MGWIHKIKHDGDRTLIIIDQGRVRGHFPDVAGTGQGHIVGWSRLPASSPARPP